MRDGLAWRWIGLHAAVLAGRGLVLAPVCTLWSGAELPGWEWIHALLTWLPIALLQTRAPGPGSFPVPFRWWGLALVSGYLLAYWAAMSAFSTCAWVFGSWILAKGMSAGEVAFFAAWLTYGFVFPIPQAAALIWKVGHASIWLWVAAVAAVQMVMAPLGFLDNIYVGHWKSQPLVSYAYLLVMGGFHGALLGLATLVPLKRLLAKPS